MKIRHLVVSAVALTIPFSVAACGADSTSELDKGELTDELEKAGMPAEQAECAADALIDADFSKDEIDELNSGGTIDDEAKTEAFTEAMTECVLGDLGGS